MTANASQQEPLLLPNRFGRMLLQAYEEVMGHDGFAEITNLAGLNFLTLSIPPDDLERQFPADDLGKLHEMIEKKYGSRAGRGIAVRVGRTCVKYGLKEFGNSLGISDIEFRLLPLPQKIEQGFITLAELAQQYAPLDLQLVTTPEVFSWQVNRCPICWQRKVVEPCCQLAVGAFQEALFWISGGKTYLVEETSCIASGDPACTFEIRRAPLD